MCRPVTWTLFVDKFLVTKSTDTNEESTNSTYQKTTILVQKIGDVHGSTNIIKIDDYELRTLIGGYNGYVGDVRSNSYLHDNAKKGFESDIFNARKVTET